jgi:hypothetical protein
VENPSLIGLLVSDFWGLYRAYRKLDDVLITEHFVDRYVAALEAVETAGWAGPELQLTGLKPRC